MNQAADLEPLVLANLNRSLQLYQELSQTLDQMLSQEELIDSIESQAALIRDAMAEITHHEQQSQESSQQYRSSRSVASEPVKQVTSRLGDVMQEVLFKIGRLENAAQKSRQMLLPQLRNEVKVVQMKSAYNQYQ